MDGRKGEYLVLPLFFKKAMGQKGKNKSKYEKKKKKNQSMKKKTKKQINEEEKNTIDTRLEGDSLTRPPPLWLKI